MNSIVTIEGKSVFTTTLVIAEGVGIEHRSVIRLLNTHSKTATLSGFEITRETRGGRPITYAKLSELQATFLITLMRNSEKVVQFKETLTKEFFRQREVISALIAQQGDPSWQNIRRDGKKLYQQKTDVIQRFVEYAKDQGSKSPEMYYTNLATMENGALFFFEQKYKNIREVLTIRQLMQVGTADCVIEKALDEGMAEGLSYKDCFRLAKTRIIAYAEIIGKSSVHELLSLPSD